MASLRPFILAAALIPTFVACGDDGGGVIIPEGEHYQFVSKKVDVPTNSNQAREYGLDLNNDKTVDNALGMVLGTLATMGFDIQGTLDEAVLKGSIILLVDFQTKDFTNTTAAGVKVLLGDNPMPAACNQGEEPCNMADPPVCAGCGHHLAGTGMFSIDPSSPNLVAIGGRIVNGTFTGGPGDLSLQIALGGTTAIQLDLIGARAKASGISADAIESVVLAGALTEDDLNAKVIPAIQAEVAPLIVEDCPTPTAPPACGCMDGSTGQTVLDLFDAPPYDCTVSVDEIKNNGLIQSLLAPDVSINGKMALSLGIKVEATKATFPAQD